MGLLVLALISYVQINSPYRSFNGARRLVGSGLCETNRAWPSDSNLLPKFSCKGLLRVAVSVGSKYSSY